MTKEELIEYLKSNLAINCYADDELNKQGYWRYTLHIDISLGGSTISECSCVVERYFND